MKTLAILAALVCGGVLFTRYIGIGRKAPRTMAERRRESWGGMPKRWRETQPKNRWKLRIARTPQRRRSA